MRSGYSPTIIHEAINIAKPEEQAILVCLYEIALQLSDISYKLDKLKPKEK